MWDAHKQETPTTLNLANHGIWCFQDIPSLKLTASLPLQIDGWKKFAFPSRMASLKGRTRRFREGIQLMCLLVGCHC